MLRAFPAPVEAAAHMWSTLPRPGQHDWPGVDPLFRLVSTGRRITSREMPGCGRATRWNLSSDEEDPRGLKTLRHVAMLTTAKGDPAQQIGLTRG